MINVKAMILRSRFTVSLIKVHVSTCRSLESHVPRFGPARSFQNCFEFTLVDRFTRGEGDRVVIGIKLMVLKHLGLLMFWPELAQDVLGFGGNC